MKEKCMYCGEEKEVNEIRELVICDECIRRKEREIETRKKKVPYINIENTGIKFSTPFAIMDAEHDELIIFDNLFEAPGEIEDVLTHELLHRIIAQEIGFKENVLLDNLDLNKLQGG